MTVITDKVICRCRFAPKNATFKQTIGMHKKELRLSKLVPFKLFLTLSNFLLDKAEMGLGYKMVDPGITIIGKITRLQFWRPSNRVVRYLQAF